MDWGKAILIANGVCGILAVLLSIILLVFFGRSTSDGFVVFGFMLGGYCGLLFVLAVLIRWHIYPR